MRMVLAVAAAASIAVGASAAADGSTSATSYTRSYASATFLYIIDYGSNPDSTFNGKYTYNLTWRLRTIVAFDGRRISALGGLMLADGTVSLEHNLTQWNGTDSRTPIRCKTPGSKGGRGQEYVRETDGGRFSGGGGVGSGNGRLTANPGRAVNWSIECSATESLAIHGLQDGPAFRVPAPPKSLFRGEKAFNIGCRYVFEHAWDPSRDVPGAHTFTGITSFAAKFTPFPADQLDATKKRLRDAVGKDIPGAGVPVRDC